MSKFKLLAFAIDGDVIDEKTFAKLPIDIKRVVLAKLRKHLEPSFAAKLAKQGI